MDTLSLILFILLIILVFSFVFRVLWFLMPFILIALGILYFKNRFSSSSNTKQTNNRYSDQTSHKKDDDVVDVEFKVRDSDED